MEDLKKESDESGTTIPKKKKKFEKPIVEFIPFDDTDIISLGAFDCEYAPPCIGMRRGACMNINPDTETSENE